MPTLPTLLSDVALALPALVSAAATNAGVNTNAQQQYKGLNVTVDDTYGDFINSVVPTFQPSDLWVQGSSCWQCALRPNLAWTTGGTWTVRTCARPSRRGWTVRNHRSPGPSSTST